MNCVLVSFITEWLIYNMPRRWTKEEEKKYEAELRALYVQENLTIAETGARLGLAYQSVYDRLVRLGIPTQRGKKLRFCNQRTDVLVPKQYTSELAELVGILLGDGHINATQLTVTLGSKEKSYAIFVCSLIESVFTTKAKYIVLKNGYFVVYVGSTLLVNWMLSMGLVHNKVKEQVGVPQWILHDHDFMRAALRGLFDTDGSVYKLRHGVQLEFSNRSAQLLEDVRIMLLRLGFHPSIAKNHHVYLTRRQELSIFFSTIGFHNSKHEARYRTFMNCPSKP